MKARAYLLLIALSLPLGCAKKLPEFNVKMLEFVEEAQSLARLEVTSFSHYAQKVGVVEDKLSRVPDPSNDQEREWRKIASLECARLAEAGSFLRTAAGGGPETEKVCMKYLSEFQEEAKKNLAELAKQLKTN